MNEESDGTLVRRTCSGEPRAFEALVRRHEKTVYNAALRMLHDREEARDVTQTVFLKVYEHLGEYDPSHKFYSWIYRIALNESIKSLQRRKPTDGSRFRDARWRAGPERVCDRRQLSDGMAAAIMSLRTEYRAVIVLRHFMDCSYEDMAAILELPEKTVKSRLFSARQLLKTAHGNQGMDVGMTGQDTTLELINAEIDGVITGPQRAELNRLLLADPSVRALRDELTRTCRALDDMPREELPAGLHEAIVARAARRHAEVARTPPRVVRQPSAAALCGCIRRRPAGQRAGIPVRQARLDGARRRAAGRHDRRSHACRGADDRESRPGSRLDHAARVRPRRRRS